MNSKKYSLRLFTAIVPLLMVVVAALLLNVSSAGATTGPNELVAKLELICQNKPVELSTVAQVKALIELLEANSTSTETQQLQNCPERTRRSLLDLKPVLEVENVCSSESVDAIGHYHLNHVYKKSWWSEMGKHMPKSVKQFFIAYGYHVSKSCKQAFRLTLEQAESKYITDEDTRIVAGWTAIPGGADFLEQFAGTKMLLEDLFIVSDFRAMSAGDGATSTATAASSKSTEGDTIAVEPQMRILIEEVKRRCSNKFKPIYDRLVVPIVKLAYLGFDYKEENFDLLWAEFTKKPIYKRWYRVVFVCESMVKLKTRALPEDELLGGDGGGDGSEVDLIVLTDEEKAKLRSETGLEHIDQPNELEEKPVEYGESIRVAPERPLLAGDEDDLKKQLKRFDSSKDTMDRIRMKMIKKFPRLLSIHLGSGKLKFGLSKVDESSRAEILGALSSYGKSGRSRKELLWRQRKFHALMWALRIGAVSIAASILIIIGLSTPIGPPLAAVSLLCGILLSFVFVHTRKVMLQMEAETKKKLLEVAAIKCNQDACFPAPAPDVL